MRVGFAATVALAAVLLTGCAGAPTVAPEPAGTRDVGIQLFEWNWNSIARECTEVLGPAGIAWVLTSPPNEHVRGTEWWTSYQPVSYRVESRLGTREEFAAMTGTCADAGVDIIADAVINHMAGQSRAGTGIAGSPFEHYSYPGIYDEGDFHHCTESASGDIANYDNAAEVQNCELVNLADLATESAEVRATIVAYLQDLLSLGAAGFRIDAAKHMPAEDIAAIVAELPEDTRILQEVIRGEGEPITPEQYVGNGEVFEFAFARTLKSFIEGATLSQGPSFATGEVLPSEDAVVFVANHDTERNGQTLSYKDGAGYLLANAYLLAQPYGTPVLYAGYAFEDTDAGPEQDESGRILDAECAPEAPEYDDGTWVCAQRWDAIAGMLAFRSAVGGAPVTDEFSDAWAYAFGRGAYGFVVLNDGRDDLARTFQTSLAPGSYTDVFSGQQVTVGGDGSFTATVPAFGALAIHVGAAR